MWADTAKAKILHSLEDKAISDRLTTKPGAAQLHVVDMAKSRNPGSLADHLKLYGGAFNHVLGVVPTGWTLPKCVSSEGTTVPAENDSSGANLRALEQMKIRTVSAQVSLLEVPYSEHSSYSEMRRFVQFLQLPNTSCIVPTVNVGSTASRANMKAIFEEWLLGRDGCRQKANPGHSMSNTMDRYVQFMADDKT